MDGLSLQLPRYLYVEKKDENGVVTGITYATDKLISWSGNGCGDAVGRLCEQIYSREIEEIDAREEQLLLLLEEQWLKLENGIDDEEEEAQYDLACEAACSEAQAERQAARQRKQQRHASIQKLVLESMEHMANNTPQQPETYLTGYVIGLLILSALAYVLLS